MQNTHDIMNELRLERAGQQRKVPWQINSNATLKILKRENSEVTNQRNTVTRLNISQGWFWPGEKDLEIHKLRRFSGGRAGGPHSGSSGKLPARQAFVEGDSHGAFGSPSENQFLAACEAQLAGAKAQREIQRAVWTLWNPLCGTSGGECEVSDFGKGVR